jgi:hypothetical protein
MFNKSILAAALLTVGTIAGGSAVSAAEIGVRHSSGWTNRHITHGTSSYLSRTTGTYREDSSGSVREVDANGFSVTELATTAPSTSTGTFSGNFFGDAEGRATPETVSIFQIPTGRDNINLDVRGLVGGTINLETTEGSSESSTTRNGNIRVASSEYSRVERGNILEVAREDYRFSGGSHNTFSELSTFSR